MEENKKRVEAFRHSTSTSERATLIEETDINHCKIQFDDGVVCTAVHNVYNGFYYADDMYGLILAAK